MTRIKLPKTAVIRTRRRGAKATAIVLSSLLALTAAEILLRAFAPRRTVEVLSGLYPAMFKSSDYLPYRLRENYSGRLATTEFDTSIRINSRGYRNAEFGPGGDESLRILVIGDSFTFGWGVEANETYADRLRQILAERYPSRPVEVINAGFAACYSPDTYYLYLKEEGLRLDPDVIIVGVFVGNDLDSDFAFENEWVETDAAGLPLRIRNRNSQVVGNVWLPRVIPFRYRAPLVHRLHVFQALADLWWELKPRLTAGIAHGVMASLDAWSGEPDDVPFIYRTNYAERTSQVMSRVQSLLAGMQRLAMQQRIPLYIMLIPDRVQFAPDAFRGLNAEIAKPQRLLREFFDREGMQYLDLLPLTDPVLGRSMYFPMDGHWNTLGHRSAAEQMAVYLIEHLKAVRGRKPSS